MILPPIRPPFEICCQSVMVVYISCSGAYTYDNQHQKPRGQQARYVNADEFACETERE